MKDGKLNMDIAIEMIKSKFGDNEKNLEIWNEIADVCEPIDLNRCERAAKFMKCFYTGLTKRGINPKKNNKE